MGYGKATSPKQANSKEGEKIENQRTAVNTKSGLRAAILGWAVFFFTPVSGFLSSRIGWDISLIWQPEIMEQFVIGSLASLGVTGGSAAWYNDKISPRQANSNSQRSSAENQIVVDSISKKTTRSPNLPDKKFNFSKRSRDNLVGVDHALVKICYSALNRSKYDFIVTSGLRTEDEQAELVKAGKSLTHNSRHLTGRAIDIAAIDENGRVSWELSYYYKIAEAFQTAAQENGINLIWGGEWSKFPDFVHFELGVDLDLT